MAIHRASRPASIVAAALVCLMTWVQTASAVTLLRDADAEFALKQVATPILQAAGLSPNRVKILIVDDPSLNAFVVSQDAIFIHQGLLSRLTSAPQLQGIIAHEAAHIINGHLTRRLTNLRTARTAAGLGVALAVAAAAAGAGEAAGGVAVGVQGAALRRFFSHTRAEESSADATAVQLLRQANIPTTGLLEVMQIFRGQEVLSEGRQDPYVRSHPLSRDRVRAITASTVGPQPDADKNEQYWFDRAKGKLTAFKRSSKWTLKRAGESGYADIKAIRQAGAYHKASQTKKALRAIDGAIKQRPKDAFLYDLKGQILMESRQFAAAANVFSTAAKLAPREALIHAGHGRALLASGNPKAALGKLERAHSIDYRDSSMLRALADAYARTGQQGMAALITSERFALRGRLDTAGIHAKRASDLLARGSGPWQRAQDVLNASERFAKKRKR